VPVTPYVSHIDLLLNEIRNVRIHALMVLPTPTPERTGQLAYDLPNLRLRVCDGTSWGLQATDSEAFQGQAPAFYRSRANHTGTQTASTISDWLAALAAVPLSQFAAATADIDLGNHRATNAAPASALTDLATWGQVIDTFNNQGFKRARLASTGNLVLASVTPGATVDGVVVALNDLILLKDQASAIDNGIYRVGVGGLVRDPNSDTAAEMPAGTIVVVDQGTVHAHQLWMLTTSAGYVIGVDPITFSPYGVAPNPYTAGNGIDISANVISAVAGDGIIVDGSGISIDPDYVGLGGYYEANLPAPVTGTSITVTHNLNRRPVPVAVMENSSGDLVVPGVNFPDANTVVFTFSEAPLDNEFRVGIG
jgi:hypothetical protein